MAVDENGTLINGFLYLDFLKGNDYDIEILKGFNLYRGKYKILYFDDNSNKTGFEVLNESQYQDFIDRFNIANKISIF